MTKQEYDILREHGDRMLAIEQTLLALPNQVAECMETKVARAVASCRETRGDFYEHCDILWEERHQRQGESFLLRKVSTRTSFIVGTVGGLVGIVGVLCAVFT